MCCDYRLLSGIKIATEDDAYKVGVVIILIIHACVSFTLSQVLDTLISRGTKYVIITSVDLNPDTSDSLVLYAASYKGNIHVRLCMGRGRGMYNSRSKY